MQGFTVVDLVILVVYLAAVLFAGLHFAKKEMKGKEYFKGDGTVPWWVTSVSIFATLLSPISFLSLAGNSYAGTWIMWFAQLGMLLAIPITIKFFLPIYSKLDIDTAYHYLELRFGSKGTSCTWSCNVHHLPDRTYVNHHVPSMYGTWKSDWNQRKLTDHYHGYHCYYLLIHRRSEIRTLDRLHPGICTSDRCYFRTDLPAGTLRRWIWSNHACTYNRA